MGERKLIVELIRAKLDLASMHIDYNSEDGPSLWYWRGQHHALMGLLNCVETETGIAA